MAPLPEVVAAEALHLKSLLLKQSRRIVFAESCTSGLVAASVGRHPGASDVLCGSAVTYRNETKACWINVGRQELESPGPVSAVVAEQMALGVLRNTPEAQISASVTGHLGPDAPPQFDGTVFVGIAIRSETSQEIAIAIRHQLRSSVRHERQWEATERVLRAATVASETWRGWQALQSSSCRAVRLQVGTSPESTDPVVLSGAFNPFHLGHQGMASFATKHLDEAITFELSITNADKPKLDARQAIERMLLLPDQADRWLTACPTFEEKSELFPGATFVVGADTMLRVGDARYYQGPEHQQASIANLAARGCRFLVFGRELEGRFISLEDLTLPAALSELCESVPRSQFDCQTSSTGLRDPRDG